MSLHNPIFLQSITQKIKDHACQDLGFEYCGVAKADFLEEEAYRLEDWLKKDFQGDMYFMTQNIDKRLDPRLLVPGAQSIITLLCNYYTEDTQKNDEFRISKYAFGKDYHKVIKKKTKSLLEFIKLELGDVQGRGFVDSAPVLERAWAKKSGLGWTGKNAMLINKKQGSFFFIATLIIDHPLDYDTAFTTDHCGTCTRCLDACPTQAIIAPQIIDSNKCISYLTIELKKQDIPDDIQYKNWVFGCDICQEVCPWNRFSQTHHHPEFNIKDAIYNFDIQNALTWTEDEFNSTFDGSPVRRTKLSGIQRNIKHLLK